MMTQDRDYEDALRRALTAAAESIEPAGDGLQRIRHRLDSPRSPRSVLSACTEWLELRGTRFLIRLEPVTEAGRAALRRSRPLAALVSFLRGLLGPRAARRAGGHRGAAGSPGRLGPAGPWLKPVFAVSAAVAIVMVGVAILNHETGTLISPLNSVTSPSSQSPGLGSGEAGKSKRWTPPLGVRTQPSSGQERYPRPKSALPVPAVACTPTPTPAATTTAPAGTPAPTSTPTPSGTTSTPATPQPSDTGQPSPTPTSSPATSAATATTTAMVVLGDDAGGPAIVECGG